MARLTQPGHFCLRENNLARCQVLRLMLGIAGHGDGDHPGPSDQPGQGDLIGGGAAVGRGDLGQGGVDPQAAFLHGGIGGDQDVVGLAIGHHAIFDIRLIR